MKSNLSKRKKENLQQLFHLIREPQLNKVAKYSFCVSIKPNNGVFQRIRLDKDKIEISETAVIYKLNFINEKNEKMCYIGKTNLF